MKPTPQQEKEIHHSYSHDSLPMLNAAPYASSRVVEKLWRNPKEIPKRTNTWKFIASSRIALISGQLVKCCADQMHPIQRR